MSTNTDTKPLLVQVRMKKLVTEPDAVVELSERFGSDGYEIETWIEKNRVRGSFWWGGDQGELDERLLECRLIRWSVTR